MRMSPGRRPRPGIFPARSTMPPTTMRRSPRKIRMRPKSAIPSSLSVSADFEHPINRPLGARGDRRRDGDGELHLLERPEEFFQGVHLHVGAVAPLAGGNELLVGIFFLKAMKNADLGGDDHIGTISFSRLRADAAHGENLV